MPGLSLDQLFNGEPGAPSFIYGVVGVVYLLVLAAAVFLHLLADRGRLFPPHHLNTTLIKKLARFGIVLGALGVFLVLMRYIGVPVLSARILLYLLVLVSLGLLAYVIYYVRKIYPSRLASFTAEELRKRYMPRPHGKQAPPPSRAVKARRRNKRRR